MKVARINKSVDKFNIGLEFIVHEETDTYFNISPTWTIHKDCCTVISDRLTKTIEHIQPEPAEQAKESNTHSQKLEHCQVALTLVGFKFKDKDLDMLVSMYDLVAEFGGKLDINTITTKQFEVNERHLVKPVE